MKTRLQVVPVCAIDNDSGKCVDTLALLDSGADCHLMVADLYRVLGLSGRPIRTEIQLANGRVEVHDTVSVECAVRGIEESGIFTPGEYSSRFEFTRSKGQHSHSGERCSSYYRNR